MNITNRMDHQLCCLLLRLNQMMKVILKMKSSWLEVLWLRSLVDHRLCCLLRLTTKVILKRKSLWRNTVHNVSLLSQHRAFPGSRSMFYPVLKSRDKAAAKADFLKRLSLLPQAATRVFTDGLSSKTGAAGAGYTYRLSPGHVLNSTEELLE